MLFPSNGAERGANTELLLFALILIILPQPKETPPALKGSFLTFTSVAAQSPDHQKMLTPGLFYDVPLVSALF